MGGRGSSYRDHLDRDPLDRDCRGQRPPPRTETLPNVVWGKVMFLYVSVILSTGGGVSV